MKGWMYILICSDGSYYVGSTNNLELRLEQNLIGNGAKYTKKRLPIALVYSEEFEKIEEAYLREKQVQGWGRNKREALIKNQSSDLPIFSIAYRDRKKDAENAKTNLPQIKQTNPNQSVDCPSTNAREPSRNQLYGRVVLR